MTTVGTQFLEIMEQEDTVSDQRSSRRERKGRIFVAGTKQILKTEGPDPVYDSLSERIEREKSVSLWSYKRKDQIAHVKISFSDTDIVLDVKVDLLNIVELQKAIGKIDQYLLLKQGRN